MAITVKDIVELAQKKGCVLATGESKLSKEVYYVDTMEIPDMEAWMKPNVLYITTGYAYSGTKEKILSLIKSLHDVNAAAIAIKSRFIGAYMEEFLKLAEEYEFPIIIMPEELPFTELNYAVMEALVTSQHHEEVKLKSEELNKRKADRKLFSDLLAGNVVINEELNQYFHEQNWPKPPYYIMLIEFEKLPGSYTDKQFRNLEQCIRKVFVEEQFDSIVLSNRKIFPCIIKKGRKKYNQQYFERIKEVIAERSGHNVLMGISDENETYITFQMTYKEAINALEIAHIRKKECPVVWNEKIGYWKLLKDMSQQQQCKEFVSKKIDALIQYDKENESDLIETLEALVNHLGARNITATSLYLHRNTLMYRIKKIENLTGYDLSDPESILELSLALRLNKSMNH